MKLAAALVVAAALVAVPSRLLACSCPAPRTQGETVRRADAVFEGRVVRSRVERTAEGHRRRAVTFAVSRWWKGDSGSTVVVRTGMGDADCGVELRRGRSYQVYARRGHGDVLWTGLCTPPRPLPAPPLDSLLSMRPVSSVRGASAAPSCPGIAA